MIVSDIILRVNDLVQDDGIRWPEEEVIRWINDAQNEIIQLRPDANPITVPDFNPAEQSLQTLPPGGIRLLDVPRTTHDTGGDAVREVDRAILDDQLPSWHRSTAEVNGEIMNYTFDPSRPREFYLYPQPSEATRLEVVYSAKATRVTTPTEELDLPDIYMSPIVDYVAYRAFSKDADYAANQERAIDHRQTFYTSLGATAAVNSGESD